MSRIYGEKAELDYAAVEAFFDARSKKIAETGPLSVTMYQTEDVARSRDAHEKAKVAPFLELTPSMRALDIGCGTGRWGVYLSQHIRSYLGIDFCPPYIEAGNDTFRTMDLDPSRFHFQVLRATEVAAERLEQSPPFDLIIIAGVLAFLNDDDADRLFEKLPSLAAPGARIYLREPMATDKRLTLLSFPSEQLNQDYSAVYRTHDEMLALMSPLVAAGAELTVSLDLFSEDSSSASSKPETAQRIYILRMSAK